MSAAHTSKIRIYDLAKELKMESKRLIEEVRREGVDVSVPSNTISKELAEKIRNKYFPKKEPTVQRAIRVVKKAKHTEAETPTAPEPTDAPVPEVYAEAEPAAATAPAPEQPAEAPTRGPGRPLAPRAHRRPPAPALKAGVQPGQRVQAPVAPTTPAQAPRERERGRGGRDERRGRGRGHEREIDSALHGTPGETATPQTTYIPPADARRPGGRNRGRGAPARPGHGLAKGGERGRGFERDYYPPPRPMSLESRIAQSLNVPAAAAGVTDMKQVRLVEGSTVKEFADKLGIRPKDIQALLLQRGVFATLNQPLDNDMAQEIGRRFGFDVQFVGFEEMVTEEEFEHLLEIDADDVELPRAPVVTVMGHVDHGKTSLLDGIRTTNVAAGEAGGITQHIGAYSVKVPSADDPEVLRRVVFLDTPGHEAFTMMRARGAKATDVVVLVVAADDGVMPQTIEAIEHARAAHVPIVVAINKIDKPDANPDRVRQELAQQGLNAVEWGGETEMVQVSAKKRENLETLLETILLTSDILNLKASPTRLASGVVLEAKLDRGRGAVATVLVQQGTLRVADPFIVGQISGKVRATYDDRGEHIDEPR